MKNIHVLPTDKETRLYLSNYGKELNLASHPKTLYSTGQNIYITNSEEIKEGDWFITTDTNEIHKSDWVKFHFDNGKKIILTTDLELQEDGLQAIDDDFLEWFVKNPSCEEIKPQLKLPWESSKDEYEIIIPKEEPKQETLTNDTDSHSWGFENFEVIKTKEDAKIFVETMENIPEPNDKLKKAFRDFNKQETLEETAEKASLLEFPIKEWYRSDDYNREEITAARDGFKRGAKWQKEQHNFLPGFLKQFDPKEGEINGEEWTAVHFLKWLALNKFKIVK